MASGGFLHHVYSGLESCWSRLAHGIDESVPTGNEPHRLLSDQLSEPIPGLRPALLSRELAARIDDSRRFRHAFRHMHFSDLEWARLKPLVTGVPALLGDFDTAVDDVVLAPRRVSEPFRPIGCPPALAASAPR